MRTFAEASSEYDMLQGGLKSDINRSKVVVHKFNAYCNIGGTELSPQVFHRPVNAQGEEFLYFFAKEHV